MKGTKHYSPEVRERAVRLVREQQIEHGSEWAAIASIAGKIGCTPETLRLNRRPLEPIGNIPPAEAEARYYAQVEVLARAA